MTHHFFQKTESEQKWFLRILGILLFSGCNAILVISYLTGFYFLAGLIPLSLLITASFIDLPLGTKKGKFIYYSPLFITEPEKNNKIVIHGGSLFDYLYTITPDLKGRERTRFVLYGFVLGLIRFIAEHENRNKDDLHIRGTSYFINQRTAARFGLKTVQTDIFQYLIILLNYIPLTLSFSFLKQELYFPKISEIKTYEGKLSDLARHKEKLMLLKSQLEPV